MSKLYYTVSGIVTPAGGRPVHRLREDIKKISNSRCVVGRNNFMGEEKRAPE